MAPWRKGKVTLFPPDHEALAQTLRIQTSTPWKDLPDEVQKVFLYGSGKEENHRSATTMAAGSIEVTRAFEGVIPNMERRYRETDQQLGPGRIRALSKQPPLRPLWRLSPERKRRWR